MSPALLLVGDDPDIVCNLERTLQEAGHLVRVALDLGLPVAVLSAHDSPLGRSHLLHEGVSDDLTKP